MKEPRPKRKAQKYDAAVVVAEWLSTLPAQKLGRWEEERRITRAQLQGSAPKRYTAYEPLVLLPTGTFASPPWSSILDDVDENDRSRLWHMILEAVPKTQGGHFTHLAVNGSIPLRQPLPQAASNAPHCQLQSAENVLRSPLHLSPLCGEFGPGNLGDKNSPTSQDFDAAFWVSTKQNGIMQTWAPRWTMFSRGNVTEKARLLNFHSSPSAASASSYASSRKKTPAQLGGKWAVDLYAGIGYFVFSYARLGMRVLGWELNPWSVEGLRRGAERNGWSVKVVEWDELEAPTCDVVGDERIVVFLEDNRRALERIAALKSRMEVEVLHVNGGLLPTSREVWSDAWRMVIGHGSEVWLHLHENVGEDEILARGREIEGLFRAWIDPENSQWIAAVEHVEKVKTFAPRVWHCVFDVYITKPPVSIDRVSTQA